MVWFISPPLEVSTFLVTLLKLLHNIHLTKTEQKQISVALTSVTVCPTMCKRFWLIPVIEESLIKRNLKINSATQNTLRVAVECLFKFIYKWPSFENFDANYLILILRIFHVWRVIYYAYLSNPPIFQEKHYGKKTEFYFRCFSSRKKMIIECM